MQDHVQDVRRSRVAVAVTLVVGALVLWWSLALEPGRPLFYVATLLLAVVWAGGSFAAGGVRPAGPGREPRRLVVPAVVLGLLLLAVFLVGALVVAQIPPLTGPVDRLLDHARQGSLPLVLALTMVNGIAEEMFFRGALYAAVPARLAIAVTTAVYALSTVGSGVPLLVFAAVLLGLVTALQRRATGGVLAPALTHITWSAGMLLLLPPVLDLVR